MLAGEAQPPIPVSETGALLNMLERAATDPRVDIDKFERLLQMQRQVKADHAKEAFAEAMAAMQPELPIINERGKTNNSTYAKWEDIVDQIKPVLAKHGFNLSFRTAPHPDGKILVTGILEKGAHSTETSFPFPIDTGPGRNAIQAVGSSMSYGKRYVASMLLNLTSRVSQDDDGKVGGDSDAVSDEQAETIRNLLTETKSNLDAFLKYFKCESVSDLPAERFDEARKMLTTKRKRASDGGADAPA